jgi:predicted CXXCH cytochrome family protein
MIIARLILIVILGIFFQTSPSLAITKRTSKECLLCHVLWFDVFKTDQKTLLKHKDSSIVIAGSIGLASSREMCESCHDGYLVDSRVKIVKGNPHHQLKKPPDSLQLPKGFRLDMNNEIYCGTCHTLHDIRGGETVGSTPFLRLDNERSQMCMACHLNKTNRQDIANHPVLKQVKDISILERLPQKLKFGPKREIICQSCHNAHGNKALVAPSNNSTLCLICHQIKKTLIDSKHDLRLTLPEAVNIKQQNSSRSGPCGACHIPHNAGNRRLWARKLAPGNPAKQMCLSCHGEKSGYQTTHIGEHSHPMDIEPDSKIPDAGRLPLYSPSLAKNSKGRIQCFTCHAVHQWDPNNADNRGAQNVEGDASNSFLRIANRPASDLCIACHGDKKQLVTSDHNLAVTAPKEENLQKLTAAASGPCGSCHVPHNASGRRLWGKRLSADRDFVSQLCIGCHSKDGAAKTKLIHDNNHPVDVVFQMLNIDATGKKEAFLLPLYDGDGDKKAGMKIVCLTCHEPHTWDPKNTGPLLNYTFKNMEGDTTNSFLRKANFPAPDLCKICHPAEAMVEGTAHDLIITATKSENLLGQTVAMSGQCGACHLVHNSPNKLKLWARPFGPISKKESIMNALCTSCHSKGKNAAKKIPPIAIHPQKKLINNIMRINKDNKNYTLIFDENGKEINVGNLSCPSCHNAHQWNPENRIAKDDPERKLTGKFLRTLSYKMVCMDCHGLDALLRYEYFHDPDKRTETIGK